MPALFVVQMLVASSASGADPLLVRAQEAYQRGQFTKARDGILSLLDFNTLTGADLAEARAYLAGSYLALKDRVSARTQLVLLARESPDYRLDPITFVPELVALADDARAFVERERQSQVKVTPIESPPVKKEEVAPPPEVVVKKEEPPPPPPPVVPAGPSLRIIPAASFVFDASGPSFGPAAAAWVGYGEMEGGPRVMIGRQLGVGAEVAYLPWPDKVSPRFGGRFTVFPGADAFGGGPVIGLRLPIAGGLSVTPEIGAEFFRAPDTFRTFALTLAVGLGFDVVGN